MCEDDGSFDATARVVDAGGDDRRARRRGGAAPAPARASSPVRPRVRDQLSLVLEAARRRGTPPDHVLLSGPPGLGKTTLAMIVARRAGAADPDHQRPGHPARRRPRRRAVLARRRARCSSSTRSTGCRGSAEEMLYLAMEDFRVDVIVGKGPGRHGDPARAARRSPSSAPPRGPGCCPPRCATGSGSPGTSTSTPPTTSSTILRALGPAARASTADAGRHHRDRPPVPRHAPHRQPAAAPGARLGPGARPPGRRPARPRTRPWRSSTSTTAASTGSTAPCSRRCAAGSAAARWGCRPSPWPWGRRPTPSRRSPSRSSCARASSSARPRGRAATPLAWQHLGLTPPPARRAARLPLDTGEGRFGADLRDGPALRPS